MGPILFVLYINDLPSSISSESDIFLFADDTKIFKEINSIEDCEKLQSDIYLMNDWSEKWLLKFHPEKCKTMRIGRSKVENYDYKLRADLIPMVKTSEEKDIGVIIDDKLSFEKHISEKVNKANSVMGVIRRTFEYLDITTFKTLYTSLVRPHVEFANQVWSPYLKKKHIDMIENVQKRATKQLPGMKELPYEERLRVLNLPTLAYRRVRGDLIETYKILTDKYDPEVSRLFTMRNESTTRGHNRKIFKKRPRLNTRKYSFCYRVVDLWNQLPEDIVEAKTKYSFERRLDRYLETQPIKYDYRVPFIYFTGTDQEISSDEDLELVLQAGESSLLPEEDL